MRVADLLVDISDTPTDILKAVTDKGGAAGALAAHELTMRGHPHPVDGTYAITGDDGTLIIDRTGLRKATNMAYVKHLQGEHDQKSHGSWAASVSPEVVRTILEGIKATGGLSVKLHDGSMPTEGFMVAKGTEFGEIVKASDFFEPAEARRILSDYARTHRKQLDSEQNYLGLWHNVDDGNVYLDVSENIMDEDEATRRGRERDQISIWDVVNLREIPTGGTGAVTKESRRRGATPSHVGDDRRTDRRLGRRDVGEGREAYEGTVRSATARKEVAKHLKGEHDQKSHGSWAEGVADLPQGWTRGERLTTVVQNPYARADWNEASEYAFDVDVYRGPNNSTVMVQVGKSEGGLPNYPDAVGDQQIRDQLETVSALQAVAPVDGLQVRIGYSWFEYRPGTHTALGYVRSSQNGAADTTINLTPAAVKAEKMTDRHMPVLGSTPNRYTLIHEYGHLLDKRSRETSDADKVAVLTQFQTGVSQYALSDEYPMSGREAFAEAWTGWFGSEGWLGTPEGRSPFVKYFADKYGWDVGSWDPARRPGPGPSAGFAKAANIGPDEDFFIVEGEDRAYAVPVNDRVAKHLQGRHDQRSHGSWAAARVADKAPSADRSAAAVQAARALRERVSAVEPQVTRDMKRIAASVGGRMAGLEFRLKTTDSLARKIDADAVAEFDGDREAAAAKIGDALRYTMIVGDGDYTTSVPETMAELEQAGYTVGRVKNFWQTGDPYDGVTVKVEKDGALIEFQMHTPTSFKVKETELHVDYEAYRQETDNTERRRLWQQMIDKAARIPRPAEYGALLGIGTLILQEFQTAQQAGVA